MIVRSAARLTDIEAEDIRDLVEAARTRDGVAPLSEQALLQVRGEVGNPEEGEAPHLLAVDDDRIVGYAHVEPPRGSNPASAEIVVAVGRRRHGVGRALVEQVREQQPQARFWAHGHLPAARALQEAAGLVVVRELWQMALEVEAGADNGAEAWLTDPAEVTLPEGFTARTFTVEDERAWLAVNRKAFATHPEQGRLRMPDLRDRERESWFDPRGFFLVHDTRPRRQRPATAADRDTLTTSDAPTLAAFHWTKVENGEGEVYVVGVDPAYQGLGLGQAVTRLGLAHLRGLGVARITLYVDGDNAAAIAIYRDEGFERIALDVQIAAG